MTEELYEYGGRLVSAKEILRIAVHQYLEHLKNGGHVEERDNKLFLTKKGAKFLNRSEGTEIQMTKLLAGHDSFHKEIRNRAMARLETEAPLKQYKKRHVK